jgi:FlaA1/EpsC-like NDP-sugar epimerase
MFVDFFVIFTSYMVSWLLLMRRMDLREAVPTMFLSCLIFIVIFLIVFRIFGMYESLWRYAEAHEFIRCMIATVIAAGLFLACTWIWLQPPYVPMRVPLTVYFVSAQMAGMGTLLIRMAYRAFRVSYINGNKGHGIKKAMIIGAGKTGTAVLNSIYNEPQKRYEVVCFVDNDRAKIGRRVNRVKVEGNVGDIPKLVTKHGIQVIIIAISNMIGEDVKEITDICIKTRCQLKKVPAFSEFVTDTPSAINHIQDVHIEDLLGRDVIDVSSEQLEYLTDKIVMVTGAGGSIGSELCRQIALYKPKRLVMVDISENGLYDIQQELLFSMANAKLALHAEVASIRDEAKINILFERYSPEVIFHAAAHKHVPLMESAPEEAVKNNIFGTLNIARSADKYNVERFVMVSSDKAVNPTNVMGATKRVCEMIIQCMARISKTKFVAVRFGNVLGSSGSVIPLFKSQIAHGGPVTVTHPDVIRYFMTITEAVNLVITAGEIAEGGEIFVLDMGKPVKILDLAETLIRLSGFEPHEDIKIEIIGLRPGDKLFEELLMDDEGMGKTMNRKIFVGASLETSPDELFPNLDKIKSIAYENDNMGIVNFLHELVPEYHVEDNSEFGIRNSEFGMDWTEQ